MKKFIYLFLVSILIFSCENQSEIDKLIKQRIDSKGFVKFENYQNAVKVNDTTYRVFFEMDNPMTKKRLKAEEHFYFTKDLKKINNSERIKTFVKSEGEWVEMQF